MRADSVANAATTLCWEPVPDITEVDDQPEFPVGLISTGETEAA